MGTCLFGAIQEHYDADQWTRDHWDTIALFEFNKDYDLSMALEDAKKERFHPDEWYPPEAEDSYRYQEFTMDELPELSWVNPRYDAMLAAARSLSHRKIRLLFWRDQ